MVLNFTAISRVNSSLVFIDRTVNNHYQLAQGITSDTEVILLDPFEDGVAQIAAALAQYKHVSSLHIVSHGSSGSLRLGSSTLDLKTLAQYRSQLQQWRDALTDDAEILLYGCEVAAGTVGANFIAGLQSVLGVAIAASSTLIGNTDLGGNWKLDFTTRTIRTPLAFHTEVLAAYPAVLADTITDVLLSEDFSDASGTTPPLGWESINLEGNPATDQWRFDNPGKRDFGSYFDKPFAVYDSDKLSDDDKPESVVLESPKFDASTSDTVFLQFKQFYGGIAGGINASKVYVDAYNGNDWTPVYSSAYDGNLANVPTVDLTSELAGVKDAQIRFRFDGNWSFLWGVDDVSVVDYLPPGITPPSGTVGVSESNVPDPLDFQFALQSRPTAPVTLNFIVDDKQLQPIQSLTFTQDNWFTGQTSTVKAVTDDIYEGENQRSNVKVQVVSSDPAYNGLSIADVPVQITESTIPGYTSYRTVEKTYADLSGLATANPNIASWIDIGDSYDKVTPGGAPGYDLQVLELTNKKTSPAGGKPILYVEGGIHSREYSTNEVVTRFAEQLVAGYGTDADITWLLDYFQIDINAVVNPDGRKFAEQGYSWRKNTNPNPNPADDYDPAPFPTYGVDLNRNHTFEWGEVPDDAGSSPDPTDATYRGASPASEPETQAVENFVSTLFPKQLRSKNTPASEDTSGILLDIHSYGNTVLYPWGSTSDPAPNQTALRDLGLKFGYYADSNGTPYDVYQAIGLYPTDGTTDDWAYGTYGVPGYTWELGTDFFESNDYFEKSIAPQIVPALFYAAKSVYRPYQTASAPDTTDVAIATGQSVAGINETATLRATADATHYADSNADGLEEGTKLPTLLKIKGGRYSIDAPSWIAGTKTYKLDAADGAFDQSVEDLVGTIDTTKLSVGRHTVFVESQDTTGAYGVPTAVFLDVLAAPESANVIRGSNEDNALLGKKPGNDVIYGLGGDDSIRSQSGADLVLAGNGNDYVSAGSGSDIIYGGNGNDYLDGGQGADKIYGEDGNDRLIGYDGDDLLWGGKGNDILQGGKGKDTYRLAVGEGTDSIRGFEVGADLIDLGGTIGFAQVLITQVGKNTLINFQKETLAILEDVVANTITSTSFVPV